MSQVLIQQYLNQLQDLRKVSGTHRESVVREAFKDLLKGWARSHDLVFIPEYEIETRAKDRRYVDGALLYELRMPFGYWEAKDEKDEKDDLDAKIEHKFRRGYPKDILAFITNRSFIESRTFDGFRKVVAEEFNDIYVVDLGGDVRANPKLSGTKHNVFGIQTGVAISFMVKRARQGKHVEGCRIYYARRPELETAEEKLEFLSNANLPKLRAR